MNARLCAHAVLSRVERNRAYSNLALMHELNKDPDADIADKRLATELVYGSLRYQRFLDHWIVYLANRPIKKIDPAVLHVLRLSLYQLLVLDRIPQHAVLSESGKLLRKISRKHAVGFVNALLRRTLRELKEDKGPDFPEDELESMSIEQSLPLWLLKRWVREFSLEGELDKKSIVKLFERAEQINRPAPLTLLPNRQKLMQHQLVEKLEQLGAECILGDYADQAVTVSKGGIGVIAPLVEKGLCTVMDEAAQLVGELLDPQPGERILDLCAAPGGKSIYSAAYTGESGEVVSVDISENKLVLLSRQAKAHSYSWIKTMEADSTEYVKEFEEKPFDKVLLDAPCTALGIIRRHPEIRWNRKESDIQEMSEKARDILDNAVRYVKPGGSLVFSVCTTTVEEGLQQLEYVSSLDGFKTAKPETIEPSLWLQHKDMNYIDTSKVPTMDGFIAFRVDKDL